MRIAAKCCFTVGPRPWVRPDVGGDVERRDRLEAEPPARVDDSPAATRSPPRSPPRPTSNPHLDPPALDRQARAGLSSSTRNAARPRCFLSCCRSFVRESATGAPRSAWRRQRRIRGTVDRPGAARLWSRGGGGSVRLEVGCRRRRFRAGWRRPPRPERPGRPQRAAGGSPDRPAATAEAGVPRPGLSRRPPL